MAVYGPVAGAHEALTGIDAEAVAWQATCATAAPDWKSSTVMAYAPPATVGVMLSGAGHSAVTVPDCEPEE
jgi:hypothetical protein